MFVRHPNQVLSRDQLLELVWGDAYGVSDDQVKLYVGYLRRKLAPAAPETTPVETVRGFGYRYRRRGLSRGERGSSAASARERRLRRTAPGAAARRARPCPGRRRSGPRCARRARRRSPWRYRDRARCPARGGRARPASGRSARTAGCAPPPGCPCPCPRPRAATQSPSGPSAISTRPPAGVNLIAFETRFASSAREPLGVAVDERQLGVRAQAQARRRPRRPRAPPSRPSARRARRGRPARARARPARRPGGARRAAGRRRARAGGGRCAGRSRGSAAPARRSRPRAAARRSPVTAVSGVRSSCETLQTNSSFSRSSSTSCSFCSASWSCIASAARRAARSSARAASTARTSPVRRTSTRIAIALAPGGLDPDVDVVALRRLDQRGHRHREQRRAEHDDAPRREARHGPAVAQRGVRGRDVERGRAPDDVRAEPEAVEPRARLVVAEREVDLVGRHPERDGHEQQPVAARAPRRPEDQLHERDQQQEVHRRVRHVHDARAERDGLVELSSRRRRSTARSRSRPRRSPCRAARRGSCARRARAAAARSRARSSGSRRGTARPRPTAAAARGRGRARRP